jgi:hypothetical protein
MIPKPVLILGWAGVVPFAFLSLAAIVGGPPVATNALAALVIYGAVILSFMGGAQWGLEMAKPSATDEGRQAYALSVLPALAGFAAALLPQRAGLALLCAGFLALLAYDLFRAGQGIGPSWYPALRKGLTAAVTTALLLALVLGRFADA